MHLLKMCSKDGMWMELAQECVHLMGFSMSNVKPLGSSMSELIISQLFQLHIMVVCPTGQYL